MSDESEWTRFDERLPTFDAPRIGSVRRRSMTDWRYRLAMARACYAYCRACGGGVTEAVAAGVAMFLMPGA